MHAEMCRDVIQPVSVVAIVPNDPAIAVFAQVFLTVAARRRFLRRLRIARITPKGLMPPHFVHQIMWPFLTKDGKRQIEAACVSAS